jgi:hypothetical protein
MYPQPALAEGEDKMKKISSEQKADFVALRANPQRAVAAIYCWDGRARKK